MYWVGVQIPKGKGNFGSCTPTEMHWTVSNKRRSSIPGRRLVQIVRRGQRIKAKARLQNGLTRCEGDRCGGDATFRQNSLTTCYYI